MKLRHFAALAVASFSAIHAVPAAAIDVDPGDYAILPSGTNVGLAYLQYSTANSLDVAGTGDVPDSKVAATVGILRGLHYMDMADYPALVQVILPSGRFPTARIGGVDQATDTGFGDLTFGASFWPVSPSNAETGTTVGLTMFLTAPTGNYDASKVSIGSGKWMLTPQVGVIQGLGQGVYLDAIADVGISKDHAESGQIYSHDPSYQFQAYVRKQFGQEYSASIGYSGQFGGKTEIDGADTGLRTRRDQLRVYGNAFLTPTFQVQAQIASDISAKGGFENDTVTTIRFLKVF